jgi:hypothetical protein
MSIFSEWETPFVLFQFPGDPGDAVFIDVPFYTEMVDRSWNPPDLDQIVNYLRQGHRTTSVPLLGGPIVCPICEAILEPATFSQQSDGDWIWMSTLSHFVQFHHLRLPDRMVESIRSNQYRPPV